MADREPGGLVAELWYESAPDLGDDALLAALRAVGPGAERQAGSLVVPHAGDAAPPLLTVVTPSGPLGEGGKQLPSADQTWDWPEAAEALQSCRAGLLVTEMFTEGQDRRVRADALRAVVAAVARATRPRVISWPQIQRLADPELLDDLPDAAAPGVGSGIPEAGSTEGVVNVRLFSIANDPGVLVMDTLGLHVFDLPDLQCHFRDRDPAEIGALLYSGAEYVFARGDVIADGDTMDGPGPGERVRCHREPALLEPARRVIDLDLGPPWAAGVRDP